MSPRWPKKSDNFHFWWVLDAFFGFSMRTRHLPSLFSRLWHAFRQVFLKALRKTLARTSREPAKNLASTYDYCRTPKVFFIGFGTLFISSGLFKWSQPRSSGSISLICEILWEGYFFEKSLHCMCASVHA